MSSSHLNNDGKMLYLPVYLIEWNRDKHTLFHKSYNNVYKPEVGSNVEIYINPKKVNDFYDPNNKESYILIIIGLVFLIFGVLVFFLI